MTRCWSAPSRSSPVRTSPSSSSSSRRFRRARSHPSSTSCRPATPSSCARRQWEDPEWSGERGRVDDLVRKYADTMDLTPKDTTVYLCGNPGMIVNVRDIMRRCGFEHAAIKEETYWAPGEGEVEY